MSGFERIDRRSDARRRWTIRDKAREHHAGKHRGDEDEGRSRTKSERGQRRSGTESGQSPADAEDGGANDNSQINVLSRRIVEEFGEDRSGEFQDTAEADEGHRNRAGHHES